MLADYSKIGEELGFKEDVSCFVSEWAILGIPEGAIHGTNVGND